MIWELQASGGIVVGIDTEQARAPSPVTIRKARRSIVVNTQVRLLNNFSRRYFGKYRHHRLSRAACHGMVRTSDASIEKLVVP